MEHLVSDTNILLKFIKEFVKVVEKVGINYIIVSGFVVIAHGRSRGTEDIDMIIDKISEEKFTELHSELDKAGFEALQGDEVGDLFEHLEENLSVRYAWKGEYLPNMELKFVKDAVDEDQMKNRTKLPLTELDFFFSTIETNIAFKEELLKSQKDIGDAEHLRAIYGDKVDEKEINRIKALIRECRL